MPKWNKGTLSQATIFGLGVGVGVYGATAAGLLLTDPTTLHTIEMMIFNEKAAAWVGAIGTVGAVVAAVAIGSSQNNKTREMWEADREARENQRRYDAAGRALKQYDLINEYFNIYNNFKKETIQNIVYIKTNKNTHSPFDIYRDINRGIKVPYTNPSTQIIMEAVFCIPKFNKIIRDIEQFRPSIYKFPEIIELMNGIVEQNQKVLTILQKAQETFREDPDYREAPPKPDIHLNLAGTFQRYIWDFDPKPLEDVLNDILVLLYQAGEALRETYPIYPTDLIPDPNAPEPVKSGPNDAKTT